MYIAIYVASGYFMSASENLHHALCLLLSFLKYMHVARLFYVHHSSKTTIATYAV